MIFDSIGPAARKVGVSEATLRDWSDRGIVNPIRDSVGRRLFSETDIAQARQHAEQRKHDGHGEAQP
jgi:DNA-binding transcriptional MerR regulator